MTTPNPHLGELLRGRVIPGGELCGVRRVWPLPPVRDEVSSDVRSRVEFLRHRTHGFDRQAVATVYKDGRISIDPPEYREHLRLNVPAFDRPGTPLLTLEDDGPDFIERIPEYCDRRGLSHWRARFRAGRDPYGRYPPPPEHEQLRLCVE